MKAPKAPDPVETANAQGAMNTKTAIAQYGLNATNQNTPTGSLSYKQVGKWADGTPRFEATTSLTGDQQKLLDNSEQLGINLTDLGLSQSKKLGKLLGQNFQLPGGEYDLPGGEFALPSQNFTLPGSDKPFTLDNEATESRLMELGRKRLDPALQQRRASTEQDMFNRGVRPGTEAYDKAMRGVSEGENDAYNQLLLEGRGQAANELLTERTQRNQEYTTTHGMRNQDYLTARNAQNQEYQTERNARNQEYLTNRSGPINEILAMAGAGQVQNPQFQNTPGTNLPPVDYIGLVNQKYQGELANYQAKMGGLFGLGGALLSAIPFSDERLKTDIKKVGETKDGIPVKTFRYKGSPMMQLGVVAQDVEKKKPGAVLMDPSGYRRVNMAKALEHA